MSRFRVPGLPRALAIGAGLAAVLYVLGADVLHCVVLAVVAITVTLMVTSLDPVDPPPEPDPLPIPYATTLLRSFTLSDPRSTDPVGEAAGLRAYLVFHQALADHPDDPVLTRFAAPPQERWRFLPQRDLVTILDRVDVLSASTQEQR